MEMSLKEKILLSVMGVTLAFAIGGSIWVLASPKKDTEQASSHVSEQQQSSETTSDKQEDSPATANDTEDTEPSSSSPTASSESSTAATSSPSASSSPTPSSSTAKPSTSSQKATPATKPAQSQPQVASCNQDMKASYKSQYDYQVSAEKADWARRVSQWSNEASANGGSFSGYVQSKVNANKPAHDARLSQLETTYRQNLASIHCN